MVVIGCGAWRCPVQEPLLNRASMQRLRCVHGTCGVLLEASKRLFATDGQTRLGNYPAGGLEHYNAIKTGCTAFIKAGHTEQTSLEVEKGE